MPTATGSPSASSSATGNSGDGTGSTRTGGGTGGGGTGNGDAHDEDVAWVPRTEGRGQHEPHCHGLGRRRRGGWVSGSLRTLGAVLPPATAAAALLCYFGWARSAAEARYLGLDEGAMGMSPSDYMLRSIDSLYLPVTIAAVLLLSWVAARRRIVPSVTGMSGRRPIVLRGLRIVTFAWPVLPLVVWLIAVLASPAGPLIIPLSWTLGILLGAYAGHLLRLGRGTRRQGAADTLAPVLIGLLVLLTLF